MHATDEGLSAFGTPFADVRQAGLWIDFLRINP